MYFSTMMIDLNKLEKLKAILNTPSKIVIIPHRNPDGDAIGATLGLYHVLRVLNHTVNVISPNDFPHFLAWMPGSEKIIIYEYDKAKAKQKLSNADYIFTLDFNTLQRVGSEMANSLMGLTNPFIMIDHHEMPDNYAELTFSFPNYGSTCELLYDILETIELTSYINQDAATCIYTGIVTDSGSFRFPKTSANTHRIISYLIDKGVDNPQVHNNLYNNSSFNRLQLLGTALTNLKILPDKTTALLFLNDEDLLKNKHVKGDTDGFVNYGLSIEGIDLVAFFIERREENMVKISFRSEGNFDVNQLARTYFEGGGHVNAAGGKSTRTLKETILYFEEIIEKHKIEFYA